MSVEIPLKQLAQRCDPFVESPWGSSKVTRDMVKSAIEAGDLEATPFNPKQADHSGSQKYHTRRIAYLAVNGWSDPISIDVGVPGLGCYVDWFIDDGNHRVAAALVMGRETISAEVSGDMNYAFDLFGVDVREPA
jgi:hypothetical protein